MLAQKKRSEIIAALAEVGIRGQRDRDRAYHLVEDQGMSVADAVVFVKKRHDEERAAPKMYGRASFRTQAEYDRFMEKVRRTKEAIHRQARSVPKRAGW